MISIEAISKYYGTTLAVDRLSLTVRPGEIFACLGPNGAGKTTTIKMMVGLLRPSRGTVTIGGHDIRRQPEQAKALMSYVPDFPFLYEKLSGREFLDFITMLYPQRRAAGLRRRDGLLTAFGLHEQQYYLIEQYSHGMKQKLVFTAAFMHEPPVLIIDEPMVGLDPQAARTLKDLLRERAAAGAAVFLSTHQLAVAEEVADRIGIIDRGTLIASGTLEELRAAAGGRRLEDIFLRLTQEQ